MREQGVEENSDGRFDHNCAANHPGNVSVGILLSGKLVDHVLQIPLYLIQIFGSQQNPNGMDVRQAEKFLTNDNFGR